MLEHSYNSNHISTFDLDTHHVIINVNYANVQFFSDSVKNFDARNYK